MSATAEEPSPKKVHHLRPSYGDDESVGPPPPPPPPPHHHFHHDGYHHHPPPRPPFFPHGPPPPFQNDEMKFQNPPPTHYPGMFHPHGGYHGYPGQFPAPPPSPPSASGQLETITIKQVPYMRWEEDENGAKLAVDVAGFKAKGLELSISKQHLLIKGDRRNKFGDSFVLKREIYLNALIYEESAVEAIYEQDLLEITIPKKKKDIGLKSRVIPIHFPSGMEDDSMMEAEIVIVNNDIK